MVPHTKPLFCLLRTSSLLESVHCAACGRCTACVLLARGSAGSTLPGRGSEAERVHLIKKKITLQDALPTAPLRRAPLPSRARLCHVYRWVPASTGHPWGRAPQRAHKSTRCCGLPRHHVPGSQFSCAAVETDPPAGATALHFQGELNFKNLTGSQVMAIPSRLFHRQTGERPGPSELQGKLEVLVDRAALELRSLHLCTLLSCCPRLR